MRTTRIIGALGMMLLLAVACSKDVKVNSLRVVPEPVSVHRGDGAFVLKEDVTISISGLGQNSSTVKYVLNTLRLAHIQPTLASRDEKSIIRLVVSDSLDPRLGNEGYRLDVSDDGIVFSANTEQGLFYAYQTFLQMLPPDVLERSYSTIGLPYCSITDYPRFSWRAVYLDVCSHYYSPSFIKKMLDIMANYKLNRFVWHLADNHGWRIPSRKFPLLNSMGSWRVYHHNANWDDSILPQPGEKANYGGFYSRQDILDIVEYAASLNIDVIPSIELPGNCSPLLSAYPQFSCDKGLYPIPSGAYSETSPILCAGEDSTLIFVQEVLEEITEMFPSKYIHIGGSSCQMKNWSHCSKCRKRMADLHISHNDQLFAWFLSQVARQLDTLGRCALTWELPDGVNPIPRTIVTSRSFSSGVGAAQAGNTVVMCPPEFCLLSRYQTAPQFHLLPAVSGVTTLCQVYSFNPVPASTPRRHAGNIVGAQCILSTEYISNEGDAEYMLLPRLLAFSETPWSSSDAKNWNRFRKHVEDQKIRLRAKGYNFCQGSFTPVIHSQPLDKNTLSVSISVEVPNTYLFYTTDGSTPSRNSQVYVSPVKVSPGTTLKVLPVYQDKPQDSIYVYTLD